MTGCEIFNLKEIEANLYNDDSITEYEYHKFTPVNSNNNLNTGNINIVIQQQDLITLPCESYFYFEGRLRDSNDAVISAAKDQLVSLINNAMMYLFNQITYLINEQEVEVVNYPGQTSTMIGMLKYSPDYSKTSGLQFCWLPDAEYRDDKSTPTPDNNNTNINMDIRSKLKNFGFCVPLTHIFGFMDDYKRILYGVQQQFRLRRELNQDFVQYGTGIQANTQFKITLDKVSLFMPVIKADLEEEKKLYELVASNEVLNLMFRPRFTQSVSVPSGVSRFEWNLQNTTGKPRYVLVTFQKDDLLSKANFSNMDVENISVELNARRYPLQDLNIDFTDNKYARVFNEAYSFKKNQQVSVISVINPYIQFMSLMSLDILVEQIPLH